jgi:HD-GYP domain-containing protein (c-di-GMP phosphodiesterase class II)
MRRASLRELPRGAVLAKPILNDRGGMLLTAGTELTDRYVRHLLERGTGSVTIEDPDTDDIEIPDLISDALRATAVHTVYKVFEAVDSAASHLKGMAPAQIAAHLRSPAFQRRAARLIPLDAVLSVVDEIMSEVMDVDLLTGMAAIKSYDNYTFAHSVEMATAALVVGRKLRLDRGSLKRLARGCLMHDIGKIFISDAILNKQGRLTAEEQKVMQAHPTFGFELLQAIQPNDVLVNHVALQHHERQDGHGYPRGLSGNNRVSRPKFGNEGRILLIAEIASVADVYDALASDRPYRGALAPEVVVETLQAMAGTYLNSELLEVFLSAVPLFPVGMTVRVTGGRLAGASGVVAKVNRWALDRPVVRLTRDPADRPIKVDLDLSASQDTAIESVL